MNKPVLVLETSGITPLAGGVDSVTRPALALCRRWMRAFSAERKDHRYYELIEDTIQPEFEYRYFLVRDGSGEVGAVQPFFLLDQDLLAGIDSRLGSIAAFVRRFWPRFLVMRTLMVGCAAGEGHLDGEDEASRGASAVRLASTLMRLAQEHGAGLVVLKEFPAKYRKLMEAFLQNGFTRVPSFPMTRLNIDYPNFDEYVNRAISRNARMHLRRNLRIAERAAPINMTVVTDITPFIDEVYPLYLQVYERSKFHFEKLTKEYFCGLGQRMPDKARFFIWRQNGKAIAFSVSMIQDDAIYAEYLGLDYAVALDLRLYFYAFRDVVNWGMANGYKWFRSTGLNYDPKYHLGSELDPLDLYVGHTSGIFNALLRRILPLLEPTRYDKTLKRFSNYGELWAKS